MVKYSIEYHFKSSTKVLYTRLSTASGLSEWFAEDVHVNGSNYIFFWEGNGQEAKLLSKKDQKFVKFKWIDDDDDEA
ncbi:MAG: START-like domain-containing protein, partial [Bacteroidota bacterium]